MQYSGYSGPSGRTRTERVHVFRPDREPVELEVFRVVNVDEYPELRQAAIEGKLHQLDDGELIDVPFVYHDPAAHLFVLVIPHGARARELSERARLLDSLMCEHDEDVPEYVRHFPIVYGRHGLRALIDDSETMEVDATELEPVDDVPLAQTHYPRLASLLPAATFWTRTPSELAPLVDGEQLWLFVKLGEDELDAFAEANSDLLIQLKVVHQLPVCILALVDSVQGVVRRAFINPVRSADGRIVELLRRDFSANVVVYDRNATALRSFRVEAPRAANAKLIIDRTDKAPQPLPGRWEVAADECRAAPPAARSDGHPFVLEAEAQTPAVAQDRLRRLEAWSGRDKIEEALLILSVPRPVFELARRRVVADAVRFGIAMSNEVLLQAVRFGLGRDAKSLAASLAVRFEEIVASGSSHDLDEPQIQANRVALDELSRMHGTSPLPAVSCTMEHSG